MDQNMPKCSCVHHKMVPIFIVLLGLLFLLTAVNIMPMRLTDIVWPIIIILIGFQKLFEQRCGCCGKM